MTRDGQSQSVQLQGEKETEPESSGSSLFLSESCLQYIHTEGYYPSIFIGHCHPRVLWTLIHLIHCGNSCCLITAMTNPVLSDPNLYNYKGFCFPNQLVKQEYVDSLQEFEIKDSDVFLVAYPKSGSTWSQQILSLIFNEGHRNGTETIATTERVPWLEYNLNNVDYVALPSPRLFASNLIYHLLPKDLRSKKGKVIYVTRNPKDVMNSYYHFENIIVHIKKSPNFEHFMEKFLAGDVVGSSWFDHLRGWYTHKDDFNILFINYEDMIRDLRSTVVQICKFVGKELDDESLDSVVKKATFKQMKMDPLANNESMPEKIMYKDRGDFMRKGTVGDWKNVMTVAQNESFDKIFQEKMKDLPFDFIWDSQEKS
ncbi:amine sulfotransferase-like isoform X3 [Ascaphus truei]|uniref:amine sulfotransferase-like isoform X3 n=1 Tax=Ascaphus truei TaxID=8439 RepID=UPI003F59889C